MVLAINALVGADPELFLINPENKYISSVKKFGGTKHNPRAIGQDCYVQEDNVAVEFNIPPAKTVDAFLSSINFSLGKIKERANALHLDLAIVPAARFDEDQLRTPQAKVFGCEPDRNAWTLSENPSPQCSDANLRSAGGHVHVGCTEFSAFDIIRAMDLFLGVPSIVLDRDTTRRQLYGKAGAYRMKSYGAEYRTLSNFWLKTDELKKWVFAQTHKALDFLSLGNRLEKADGEDIQKCINESDMNLYYSLKERYGLETALN